MSNGKYSQPVIHRLYMDSYRWIRLYKKGLSGDVPDSLVIPDPELWRVFMRAITSYDNSCTEFSGWLNPFRNRQFYERAPYRPSWYDIPF